MPAKKLPKKYDRRADWEHNHETIAEAFFKHIRAFGRPPTTRALKESTGLSAVTIDNHMKELNSISLEERVKGFKVITGEVISSTALKAKTGDTNAAKLFLQVVEKFKEGKELEVSGNVSGYDMSKLKTEEKKTLLDLLKKAELNDDAD